MSIDADPKNQDNADDDFAKHFDTFAAKKAPQSEAEAEEVKPEGNVPEASEQAPEPVKEEAAKADEPPASDTSGEQTDGGDKPPKDQPDILATLPDEARALVEQLQKERDEARHKASSDANRVSALTRKLQSLTAPPPAKAEEPSEAQKALTEKIDKLRKDYGEIAEPIIEMMEQQKSELGQVKAIATAISEERREAQIAEELQRLEALHPDWKEVAATPEFKSWLDVQPENIQALAASWDARESSVALTLFKTERAEANGQEKQKEETPEADEAKAATDARRKSQLEGGREVRSKPAPAASGPPEDFDAAFAYFTAERQRKLQEARR